MPSLKACIVVGPSRHTSDKIAATRDAVNLICRQRWRLCSIAIGWHGMKSEAESQPPIITTENVFPGEESGVLDTPM